MPAPASARENPARPRFAVNSYSTPHNSVYDDIEQTAAIGGAAVGLWEGKFSDGDDQKIADFMAEHGIAASFCVPRVHSILGIPFDRPGTPADPAERTELICASVHRLARFAPAVIAVAPGTSGDPASPPARSRPSPSTCPRSRTRRPNTAWRSGWNSSPSGADRRCTPSRPWSR